ncbi:gamma carbonic anhydrase family protein [Tianweitania populi]|uniref:UDP-3-O-(3-hydroxymyristoyl)glucosamine N-acyltransferase n=1 Tax=Tianweitania populi TaxID=1607949 RepID=A0A8J3GMN1_9HYPH|nr:gamma carbonic anhydrase family protein [Tianweitania populi]GHD24563.1 hypothetical protein GCM10016234_40770 [Tianweitania populi]
MQQSHSRVRELREALKQGSAEAATLLLAHSASLGHERLALRRYLAGRFLGAKQLEPFLPHVRSAAQRLAPSELLTMAHSLASDPSSADDVHLVASELLAVATPYVLPFEGTLPRLATWPDRCGREASLLGRLAMGKGSWLGPGSVIRADGHFVQIGDDFRLGAMSTVHIAHDIYPTIIGDRVSVGRNAVVHACTVGDDCLIEDGAVVLDGSIVESRVLIEAGSTVFPRSTLQSGYVYAGSPARPIRQHSAEEFDRRARALHEDIAAALFASTGSGGHRVEPDQQVFVARTAIVSGNVLAEASSSVFFGCQLDAARNPISIGRNTNVQDNTIIDSSDGAVTIGSDTTIGHNVHLRSCRIGAHSLVGIGSSIATGSMIDDDVLLAAGSTTTPDQHLEGGWLCGGRPARPISKLNEDRRAMMALIVEQYCAYGAAYRKAQEQRATKGGTDGASSIEDRYPDW